MPTLKTKNQWKPWAAGLLLLAGSVWIDRGHADESPYPPLPEPIASFGAAISEDGLYVYSGHVGTAHEHSAKNVSQGFYRLDLSNPAQWESLPSGPGLQGHSLVAHGDYLYRIGGMIPKNDPDEDPDLHSTADVSRYHPATRTWKSLTPLPEARSSHDAAVFGDMLYVVGGWNLVEDSDSPKTSWHSTAYVADLRVEPLAWREVVAPPFQRRALAVAASDHRIFALGGITPEGGVSQRVDIFDLSTGKWSKGPDFPVPTSHRRSMQGFGMSAFGVGDRVFGCGAEGVVYMLPSRGEKWRKTGVTLETPRFFHRLLPHGENLLFVAGAAHRAGHLDDVEVKPIPSSEPERTQTPSSAQSPKPLNWTGFRGDGTRLAVGSHLPLRWTEDDLAWSTSLLGYGQSSPVTWGHRLFVTSIDRRDGEKIIVSSRDTASGNLVWTKSFSGSQALKDSEYVARAAPTPAVDPNRVYAMFESGDLIALDHEGNKLWSRALTEDYGEFKGNHGIGASIAQTEESLVLLLAHEGPSYLLRLDKKTGKTTWKTDRPQKVSWSTPLIFGKSPERGILVSSSGTVECFDFGTGERRWFVTGLEGNSVPSPTIVGDIVLIGSTKKGSSLGIRSGGRGDVTDSHVLWRSSDALSSFGSPIAWNEQGIFVNRTGVARGVHLESGEVLWTRRIGASCWASPLALGSHIYFFTKDGKTTVLDVSAPEPVVIAENEISVEHPVHGVAAIDGGFLIRSGDRLIRVGGKVDGI